MKTLKLSVAFIVLFGVSHNTSAMFASKEAKKKARKSLKLHEEEQKKLLEMQKQKLIDERTPHFKNLSQK